MRLSYTIQKHKLEFTKPAKTSRNTFKSRDIYIIHLKDELSGKVGMGESAPLSLLSVDDIPNYEEVLKEKVDFFCEFQDINDLGLEKYPSIRFGLETAINSLVGDASGRMYQTPFTLGKVKIAVNGLVWMNDIDAMHQEAIAKIESGFNVIKFKVGALDFDEECRLLEKIRKQYSAFKITLRLDANGAFQAAEAIEQLKELSRFEIHSIEQPIATGQWDDMEQLCIESPIDVSLDEELIGLPPAKGAAMLRYIDPKYVILKPNLIGGVAIADEWIAEAQKQDIGWWATSALESNIGLNAIAQWVSTYKNPLHQGLGTGSLFSNNFESPLKLENGWMGFQVS